MTEFLEIGVRCLIGVVFFVSSVGKATGRGSFGALVASVRDMRVLPARLARPVALCVVAAESAVWLLLAAPARLATVAGLLLAVVLLTGFALAIALAAARGARVPCRCFGRSGAPLGGRHVVRNTALAVLAALGAAAAAGCPTRTDGTVVACLAGLLLGVLTVMSDDIVELFRPLHDDKVPGTARGPR